MGFQSFCWFIKDIEIWALVPVLYNPFFYNYCMVCTVQHDQLFTTEAQQEVVQMYFSDMRLLTSDCDLELSYFGKPIQLRISEVTSQCHNYSNDESLSHDMSNLNLSSYEPVSGKFITSL